MRRNDRVFLTTVLRELGKLYHSPKTFLHFRTPLDLTVAVILSAQCTDARVNIVTRTILYPKYKTAEDYVKVQLTELEDDIHSCGFYHAKAKNIQALCHLLLQEHGGKIPRTMEELVRLPGVGRKTANVILSAAFDINDGIAVDTHVIRVAQRLGLTTYSDPKKIELDLVKQAPKKEWRRVTTLIISHGRAVCTARGRKCEQCVFALQCPSSLVMGKRDLAKKPKKARA